MQPQPAPARDAYDPAIFGTSLQRVQPKKKASKNAHPFGVHLHKAATLNATNDGISNLFNGEEDDDEYWEGMAAKHGHDLQDETPADASADINVIDIRSTTFAIPVWKIGAWVTNSVGFEEWQPLTYLYGNSGADIHAKFLADFASGLAKRAAYSAVATSVSKGFEPRVGCINVAFQQEGCGLSIFKKFQGKQRRACDTCTHTKQLCVRAVEDPELGMKLCVMPRRAIYHAGKGVNTMDEWVVGG